ncbi:MAG: SWF/SNF helicase family protein [Bacteroidales bacterium]|nr:SWF/SNF helicase family protein [Bacteroidales bacterium]
MSNLTNIMDRILTAASHVIHYDLWWNPAVEAQATDRAYRIGQTQNVFVDRFITQGTFEEKINDMINRKRNLAEMTVSTGETWLGNLSNSELHEMKYWMLPMGIITIK